MASLSFVIYSIECSGRQTASSTSIMAAKALDVNIVIVGQMALVVNESPPSRGTAMAGCLARWPFECEYRVPLRKCCKAETRQLRTRPFNKVI